MIDINYYDSEEKLAKENVNHWIISKSYNLDVFQKSGFPIQFDNIQELYKIFDTMQEERFDSFIKELKGLTQEEIQLLSKVLINIIKFQLIYFPEKEIIIPLDTLISQFTLSQKIIQLKNSKCSIFEFGPGSGLHSFIFKEIDQIKTYTYTDACQSFYMLQNYINSFLYKNKFKQHVLEKRESQVFSKKKFSISLPNIKKKKYVCESYPWWKLNKVLKKNKKYDIVTSNANLLEFSEGALDDYLKFIPNIIKKDGLFFAHCLGSDQLRNIQYLINKIIKNNFAVVLMLKGNIQYQCKKTDKNMEQYFRLTNLILVHKKNKLYEKFKNRKDIFNLESLKGSIFLASGLEDIDSIFLPNSKNDNSRKIYTKDELKNILLKSIKGYI